MYSNICYNVDTCVCNTTASGAFDALIAGGSSCPSNWCLVSSSPITQPNSYPIGWAGHCGCAPEAIGGKGSPATIWVVCYPAS